MLLHIEDTKVWGHEVAVVWQDVEEAEESENASNEMMDRYQSPEVSLAWIMGWLIGQQHKPIDPGACGRELTLPVKHMQTAETFLDVFIMAYCKEIPLEDIEDFYVCKQEKSHSYHKIMLIAP
eukprot:gene12564-13850_t